MILFPCKCVGPQRCPGRLEARILSIPLPPTPSSISPSLVSLVSWGSVPPDPQSPEVDSLFSQDIADPEGLKKRKLGRG